MRQALVAVLAGAGLVLAGVPATATERRVSSDVPAPTAEEQQARDLLVSAARAGQVLTYTGTQYLATWRGDRSASALLEVVHDAGGGPALLPSSSGSATLTATPMTATADLEPRLVDLLASTYDLALVAPGRCAGRSAAVVEARRAGGGVAGRFWVDSETGLLLRREVYDASGERLRSSAFLQLDVDAGVAPGGAAGAVGEPAATSQPAAAERLRDEGWTVPARLPAGFRLLEARTSAPSPGEAVLHLAYSDGLSTLSLFAQDGRLGSRPPSGFTAEQVGARPVWRRADGPERAVWSGGGHVWTLVSDADPAAVTAAVGALPRDPATDDGVRSRLGRGLGRMAGMLSPFD